THREGCHDVSQCGPARGTSARVGADHHPHFEPPAIPGDRLAPNEVSEADVEKESAADSCGADDSSGDANAGGDSADSCGGTSGDLAGGVVEACSGPGPHEPRHRHR